LKPVTRRYKEVKMVKQTVSYDNSLEKLDKEGPKKVED
jgi:hypothetical protein